MSAQYKPFTSQEAATLLGVNVDTFQRKFLEKTGTRISELPQGKISFEQFMIIGTHFAKNYPTAADAIGRFSSDADEISGRQADAKRMKSDGSGRLSDDERTASRRTDEISGRQADEPTQADEIGRLLKQIHNQQLTLKEAQKRISELEQSTQRADALSGRQADEIGRLKRQLTDEIARKQTELKKQADDFGKNLDVLSENVRLKVEAETRKTVTATIKKEVAQEFQARFDKLQNEHYAAIKTLNDELQESSGVIQKLTADVQLFSHKWEFKIKKILDSELSVINVVSNALALVGLTLVFDYIGALAAVLMIFFFKNVMKNVKIAKREESAQFGMYIAYAIEGVYGFFHYTTFFNLLKNQKESLLIEDPKLVAFAMTVIISGLSISALIQSRKQAKDDIS